MEDTPDGILIGEEATELLRQKARALGVSLEAFSDFGYNFMCYLVDQGLIENDPVHNRATIRIKHPKTGNVQDCTWYWSGNVPPSN